jgi:hypothetical protein
MSRLVEDPKHPPSEPIRNGILQALRGLEAAMERLQKAKVS